MASNGKSSEAKLSKQDPIKVAVAVKESVVGKHGRGEVRFINGVPILYKYTGPNAEQLDAEMVSARQDAIHDTILPVL